MIYRFDDLAIKYNDYTDIKGKICREVKNGNLIFVAKGLYETDKNADGKYLAGSIYGPSYLSFDYALYLYSLIPEAVYKTYTSATYGKGKTKQYNNYYGTFTYRDVPKQVYSLGVQIIEENGYSYQLATPEKALCDKLYTMPVQKKLTELKQLMFNDLRIDENAFWELNISDLSMLALQYRCTNLKLLQKFIRGAKNEIVTE